MLNKLFSIKYVEEKTIVFVAVKFPQSKIRSCETGTCNISEVTPEQQTRKKRKRFSNVI